MVDTSTTHYAFTKPEIYGSPDTWGTKLNANWDSVDNILYTVANQGPNTATATYINNIAVPVGGIIMYNGSLASLTANWAVCDGTRGTPDLRGRFILGVSPTFTLGAVGGSASFTPAITDSGHVLSIAELPSHDHGFGQTPHGHGLSADSHSHGLNDSGHNHNYSYPQSGGNVGFGSGAGAAISGSAVTQVTGGANQVTSGLSVAAAASGIVIAGSNANITFTAQGSNTAHYHPLSSQAVPLYSPYYVAYYIQRIS